jgi:hypothetical protein
VPVELDDIAERRESGATQGLYREFIRHLSYRGS